MYENSPTTTRHAAAGDLLNGSNEVFVAPRVIDENAYARYAEDLRTLLGRVTEESNGLSESISEARDFLEEIKKTKDQRRGEIETITKLLKATDAKAARIDETIRSADEKLEALSDIDRRAEEVAERKSKEIESRIESMLEDFERKLDERAADREQKFLWAAHETEEVILERLAELRAENDRAQSILGRPIHHPSDAPVSHDSLLDVLRRTEEGTARLDAIRREIAEADYRARESADGLERALDDSAERARELEQAHESLNGATASARRNAAEAERTLRNRSDELADLTASLSSLVERAGEASGSLREVMSGCDDLREQTRERYEGLRVLAETVEGLLSQLEPWRPYIEPVESEGDLPPMPPLLRRIVEDFRSGLALDVARLADAVSSVVDRDAKPLDVGDQSSSSSSSGSSSSPKM